jgi:L-ascorbate metabolism protein UlaG (beta-lactamase superfamily)
LLIETDGRVALFDPGVMSKPAFDFDRLSQLDDIFITHVHSDHCDMNFIKQLVAKFPKVRITSNPEVVALLASEGITATDQPPEGVTFFESPHEPLHPPSPTPQQRGFHYLNLLTHPGDSHSFKETKSILALPITAPWGSNVSAFNLALELKPRHILPIHDWHWHDEARQATYDMFEQRLGDQGINFHKLQTGQPVEI